MSTSLLILILFYQFNFASELWAIVCWLLEKSTLYRSYIQVSEWGNQNRREHIYAPLIFMLQSSKSSIESFRKI